MRIGSVLIVLSITAASSVGAAGNPPIAPGKWQITYHNTSPKDEPPFVSVVCVEQPAIDHIGPPAFAKDSDCQVVTPAFDGRDLSYGVRCAKNGVSTDVKMRYQGNSYSGDVTLSSGGFVIKQHIEAVRLGVCDEH